MNWNSYLWARIQLRGNTPHPYSAAFLSVCAKLTWQLAENETLDLDAETAPAAAQCRISRSSSSHFLLLLLASINTTTTHNACEVCQTRQSRRLFTSSTPHSWSLSCAAREIPQRPAVNTHAHTHTQSFPNLSVASSAHCPVPPDPLRPPQDKCP